MLGDGEVVTGLAKDTVELGHELLEGSAGSPAATLATLCLPATATALGIHPDKRLVDIAALEGHNHSLCCVAGRRCGLPRGLCRLGQVVGGDPPSTCWGRSGLTTVTIAVAIAIVPIRHLRKSVSDANCFKYSCFFTGPRKTLGPRAKP